MTSKHHARQIARTARGRKKAQSCQPMLELLDDRIVLSSYLVNVAGDAGAGLALSGDIRYVIDRANLDPGSTITFDTSVTGPTITLTQGELAISTSVTIIGPGSGALAINGTNGGSASRIFDITDSGAVVSISGLTITGGNASPTPSAKPGSEGGNIYNRGTLTLTGDVISEGLAQGSNGSTGGCGCGGGGSALGGGIFNSSTGVLVIDSTIITHNTARGGDGRNSSSGGAGGGGSALGGGIFSSGTSLTIKSNCVISGNAAIGGKGGDGSGSSGGAGTGGSALGGGIFSSGASLDVQNSVVSGNKAAGGRGGDGSDGTNSEGNDGGHGGYGGSAQGGGIFASDGTLSITATPITGNQALGGQGGNGGVGYSNSEGVGGDGGFGGDGGSVLGGGIAVIKQDSLSITNSPITGNAAASGAGGIGGNGGQGSTIGGDGGYGGDPASASFGGGIAALGVGTMTIRNSSISGNTNIMAAGGAGGEGGYGTAQGGNGGYGGCGCGTYAWGGGLLVLGGTTLGISNSTIGANTIVGGAGGNGGNAGTGANPADGGDAGDGSDVAGGGIYTTVAGTFTNLTVTGNSIVAGAAGTAGIATGGGSDGIAGSTGIAEGGGIFSCGCSGDPVLGNSIVALNTAATDADVSGFFDSNGNNLIGDQGSATGFVGSDTIGVTAAQLALGSLQDNGGGTLTYALLPGSIAINAGNNALAIGTTDQRGPGFSRIVGPSVDIGAFEAAPTITSIDPAFGLVSGGTTVTITGTGFTGATAVNFGGRPATFTVVSDTTIIAQSPAAPVGVVDVTVTIPGGTTATSPADLFTYFIPVDNPARITSITSATPSGKYKAGDTISVTVNFDKPVTLTGTLTVNLNVGDSVTISPFSNSTHATGTYTVAPGQNTQSLDSTSLIVSGGTLKDISGNTVALVIPTSHSLANSVNLLIDTTKPTVTISNPSATTTATGPITYTILFADKNFNKNTLTAADITLNQTGTANGTVTVSGGAGLSKTVTISNITGSGTLGISIAAGTASDTAGNLALAAGPSTTFSVSNGTPTTTAAFAIGGADGTVRLLDKTGGLIATATPIAGYTGLVSVALGDFSGDAVPDLVVAAANPAGVLGLTADHAGKAFVYDGAALAKGTLTLIHTFTPFANHDGPNGTDGPYTNGLNIAVGDIDGDTHVDLIAGTRGGNDTVGRKEFGRLVVIDGTSPAGSNNILGGIRTPFGPGYQKGVVVAAGNVDGLGGDEIAVTRGGPVNSPDPAVQQIKVKVLQLKGTTLTELPLNADSTTAFAPFAGLTGAASGINRDGRVAFVDSNGDGKEELVFSALDPLTSTTNQQVRVGVYFVDPAASKGAITIASTGPDAGTYLTGTAVKDHAITHVAATGAQQNIALLTESASSGLVYLAPLTGAVQTSGFSLRIVTGGITIDGI
ncbi:MAG: IPT/TIG domain-containing protein [Planctomycetes bacterium]|nr:IPT/TIG domain-containing protein [Planctomycetota bacterium]